MHQWRAGIARARHLDHRRQFVEVERHHFGDIFGFGARLGDTGRQRLADMAHLLARQHRLYRAAKSRQTGIGTDALHAVEIGHDEDFVLVALWLDDAAHQRMRRRTAHEGDVQHAGQPDVGDKPATAAQIAVVLQAQNRGANAVVLSFCVSHQTNNPLLRAASRQGPFTEPAHGRRLERATNAAEDRKCCAKPPRLKIAHWS